jgi:hypothetical protein
MMPSAIPSKGWYLCPSGKRKQGPSGIRTHCPRYPWIRFVRFFKEAINLTPKLGVCDVASGCDDFKPKDPLVVFSWETLSLSYHEQWSKIGNAIQFE